MFTSLPWLVVY